MKRLIVALSVLGLSQLALAGHVSVELPNDLAITPGDYSSPIKIHLTYAVPTQNPDSYCVNVVKEGGPFGMVNDGLYVDVAKQDAQHICRSQKMTFMSNNPEEITDLFNKMGQILETKNIVNINFEIPYGMGIINSTVDKHDGYNYTTNKDYHIKVESNGKYTVTSK